MTITVFDVDGTLVKGQSQKIFLTFLFKNKYLGLIPYIKIYFWFILYKFGLISDPVKTMNYAFSFLKGWRVTDFEKIVDSFFSEKLKEHIYLEAEELIKKHKTASAHIVLISNAINPIISKMAEHFGIDSYLCTKLETAGEFYTGKIEGGIMYGNGKVENLKKHLETSKINNDELWVYTDHESDLPLLDIAEKPIATNPTKRLEKIATSRGWEILKLK